MKATTLLVGLSALCLLSAPLQAQAPAATPAYYQVLNLVKITPGKGTEYTQLVNDTSKKVAQMRADAGEIVSWTLLRSVMPAGQEARADYMISTIYEKAPRPPQSREDAEKSYKDAKVGMTVADMLAKRDKLSTLVATEMWRPRVRVGAPGKGHYVAINYMKVHDAAAQATYTNDIWRPMAEVWVKEGSQSGWMFATKVLPSGSETAYGAYSADMYPTWESYFTTRVVKTTFDKVHAGKNYAETTAAIAKTRDMARRELWVVVERVAKK